MPTCRNCGEHVTAQFAKVFGDNQDTVSKCIQCVPNASLDDTTGETSRQKIDSWHHPAG